MAFSNALYYPSIDIGNDNWLKSAVLFWDQIQTIVPISIDTPYERRNTKLLHDEGILLPYSVEPNHHIIEDISEDAMKYLESNEGISLISQDGEGGTIHRDKLSPRIRRLTEIHPEKLSHELGYLFNEMIGNHGWLNLEAGFANFYMTLLANRICERERMALLSDSFSASDLVQKAKLDNDSIRFRRTRREWGGGQQRVAYSQLGQGMLSSLIFEGLSFSPNTRIEDLVKFRRKRSDELGRFRVELDRLVSDIPEEVDLENLRQHIQDIYTNEYLPAYQDLKKTLKDFRFQWLADNAVNISCFKIAPTSTLSLFLGATIPQALLIGGGISIVASKISYNVKKRRMLRENPYSYLLNAKKKMSQKDFERDLQSSLF